MGETYCNIALLVYWGKHINWISEKTFLETSKLAENVASCRYHICLNKCPLEYAPLEYASFLEYAFEYVPLSKTPPSLSKNPLSSKTSTPLEYAPFLEEVHSLRIRPLPQISGN